MLAAINPVENICKIMGVFRNILMIHESWFKIVVDIIFCNHGILAYKACPNRMGDLPTQLSGAHENIIPGHLGHMLSRTTTSKVVVATVISRLP
jgi:hypothetical protein